MKQSNCKKPSERVPELHGRADLFSPELQQSLSPLTNITGQHTSQSHPLRARSCGSSNTPLGGPDLPRPAEKGRQRAPRNTIFSPLNCRDCSARASLRHIQECAGAPALPIAVSGSRGLASGPDPHPLVETWPIGFPGLRGHLSCLQCRWRQPSSFQRAAQPAPPLAAAPAPPSSSPRGGVCRLALPSPLKPSLCEPGPLPTATRLLFLSSATGASPQPPPPPPPTPPAEPRRARGPRPP